MRIKYTFSSRKTGRAEGFNQHKQPIPKLVKEVIRTSDIILEVLDSQNIQKTQNKEIESIIKEEGKKLIYILNKSDLAEISEIKRTIDLELLKPYVFFSAKSKVGHKRLRTLIKIESKKLKSKNKVRVGVIGYPNAGKSSIIKILAGGKTIGVSPESGFTKGIRKIRFTKDILILDTPGVFPETENAESQPETLKKHAEISVKTYNKIKNPDYVVARLLEQNPEKLKEFYKIDSNDSEIFLEKLGRKKAFLIKGNLVDIDRTARAVIKDFQSGKLK